MVYDEENIIDIEEKEKYKNRQKINLFRDHIIYGLRVRRNLIGEEKNKRLIYFATGKIENQFVSIYLGLEYSDALAEEKIRNFCKKYDLSMPDISATYTCSRKSIVFKNKIEKYIKERSISHGNKNIISKRYKEYLETHDKQSLNPFRNKIIYGLRIRRVLKFQVNKYNTKYLYFKYIAYGKIMGKYKMIAIGKKYTDKLAKEKIIKYLKKYELTQYLISFDDKNI